MGQVRSNLDPRLKN